MPDQPDKVVRITMQNGLPVPDVDPVEVKRGNQKVRWCADFDSQITVDGYEDLNYSSGGAQCTFACKTGTFPEVRTYKYTISANGVDNDPGLDIKP
jgi:hypothetical protein